MSQLLSLLEGYFLTTFLPKIDQEFIEMNSNPKNDHWVQYNFIAINWNYNEIRSLQKVTKFLLYFW